MDARVQLLEQIKQKGLAQANLLGLFHVFIGRRIAGRDQDDPLGVLGRHYGVEPVVGGELVRHALLGATQPSEEQLVRRCFLFTETLRDIRQATVQRSNQGHS